MRVEGSAPPPLGVCILPRRGPVSRQNHAAPAHLRNCLSLPRVGFVLFWGRPKRGVGPPTRGVFGSPCKSTGLQMIRFCDRATQSVPSFYCSTVWGLAALGMCQTTQLPQHLWQLSLWGRTRCRSTAVDAFAPATRHIPNTTSASSTPPPPSPSASLACQQRPLLRRLRRGKEEEARWETLEAIYLPPGPLSLGRMDGGFEGGDMASRTLHSSQSDLQTRAPKHWRGRQSEVISSCCVVGTHYLARVSNQGQRLGGHVPNQPT